MKHKRKNSLGDYIYESVASALIIAVLIVTIYPFWRVLMYSLSNSQAAMSGGLFLIPKEFSMTTYKLLLQTKMVFKALGNSLAKMLIGTVFNLVLTILTAYALAQRELKGRRAIMYFFYFTMLFNGGIVPTYILIKNLKLLDSFWVYVLPSAMSVFNMFILRNFFMGVPKELSEAATMEGANQFQILYHVVLPLSKSGIATIAIYSMRDLWNSYMDGVLYVNSTDLELIQVYLRRLLQSSGAGAALGSLKTGYVTEESVKMTIIVFTIIPVVIIYLLLQKYFGKGVMVGAVKG